MLLHGKKLSGNLKLLKKIMKKILFFAAVAAIAASCVNENYETEKYVLNASFDETKTALVEGTKTAWTAGDALSVFNASKGNCKFTTAIEEAAKVAQFAYIGEGFEAAAETWAFYPYNEAIATEDFATFTGLEIPEIQTPVAGGFDPAAALCYGKGQSANVSFQNLTALIKFTVAADEVYNVKVWATGPRIAGACTFDGTALTASTMKVELKGVMRNGKTFYMAVAPGTYEGLNVFVNGLPVNDLNRTNKTLEAGKIYDMGTLTNPRSTVVTYYTTTIPEPQITEADIEEGYITTAGDVWNYSAEGNSTAFLNNTCGTWNTTGTAYGYKIYHVAEDGRTLTNGGESVYLKTDDYTRNGQIYAVPYNKYAPALFFNIDWETKYNNQDNVYALVDQQDRHGAYNSVYLSKSYYDANAQKFVFDIAFKEGSYIKRMFGQLAK